MAVFITGTDTGVGKTHTAAALLRLARASGLRCAGFKPICCGDRHDAELLQAASSDGLTLDEVNPVWLKTPTAPLPAAMVEGVNIDIPRLVAAFRELEARFNFVVVEGVGGWVVPIRRDYFTSDFAVELQLPVLVVAMNRLGCLNHTMLTLRAIAADGLKCPGVVLNALDADSDYATTTNGEILAAIADVPIVSGLTADMTELPAQWQLLMTHFGVSVSGGLRHAK